MLFRSLIAACGPAIRLIMCCTPNPPTGNFLGSDSLARLVSRAPRDALLVIDEAYFLYSDVSAVGLLGSNDALLIVRTFSKAFGLAGLRLGYILGNRDRMEELRILRPVADASSLAISAGLFSLKNISWVHDRVASVREARAFLGEKFAEGGLRALESHGNFIVVPAPSESAAKACLASCLAAGFAIKGPISVGSIQIAVRISISSLATMERFWNECGQFMRDLAPGRSGQSG